MVTLVKKAIFSTELNADCTEWCPIDEYADLFTCGTYQLSKIDGKEIRLGCLYLFKFSKKFTGFIKLIQQLSMPGILDCKWCHVKLLNDVYLAIANAVGELILLKLDESSDELYLTEVHKIKLTKDDNTLLLSLDWSTGIISSDPKIVVSDSIGQVTALSLNNKSLVIENTWSLHNYEAWITAFNYWDINVFFSGGDDCCLKTFDTRIGQVVNTNNQHDGGITSLQMNFKLEHVLISGSYDENIRFWDVRNMKIPTNKISTAGGVWRLKWEPNFCDKICASCMYYGSVVIDAFQGQIITEYKEHKSINYGIDWSLLSEDIICDNFDIKKSDKNRYNVISVCSFYDNKLSLALLESFKK